MFARIVNLINMTCITNYIEELANDRTRGMMGSVCLASTFALLGVIKAVPFYMGWSYSGGLAQKVFLLLGCVVFAAISACVCFPAIQNMELCTRSKVMIGLLICFMGTSFVRWGLYDGLGMLLIRNLLIFLGVGIPSFSAGLVTGRYNRIRSFFSALECLSLTVFPIAVICLYKGINGTNLQYGIGTINYMTLAYMLMPFMLAHIMSFVYEKSTAYSNINLVVWQFLRFIAVAIYGMAILLSGTRGAMFTVLVGVFTLCIINCKYKRNMWKSVLVSTLVLSIFGVGTFFSGSLMQARMATFFDGVRQGRIVTSTGDHLTDEQIDNMVNSNAVALDRMHNRGTIYKAAIKEFIKSPICGMSPGGFQRKYGEGLYPHNIWLEILCETGMIGFLVYGIVFIVGMKSIILTADKRNENLGIIAFFMAYLFCSMISDSVWFNWYIMAILGYGLGRYAEKCSQSS